MERFPFSAIVGQDTLKSALLVNIVNPAIGGLLVTGPKGSGKSTIVHSIESILPSFNSISDCAFHCDPSKPSRFCSNCRSRSEIDTILQQMKIVSLPLSCTEDRLIGSVDVETILKTGTKKIQPGILGEVNQNVLYIDEVNLLPDHLVDDILDVAASHWNVIEREGVSFLHPSSFVLIGTMNPEEGDLRPQILDRFPMSVRVQTIDQPHLRVEVMRRNMQFEANPEDFIRSFDSDQQIVRELIIESRSRLKDVSIDDAMLMAIAQAGIDLKVDGQRPDLAIAGTARTFAALDGRLVVRADDIERAAGLVMAHRTRDGGLLEPPAQTEITSVFRRRLAEIPSTKTDEEKGRVSSEQKSKGVQAGVVQVGSNQKKTP